MKGDTEPSLTTTATTTTKVPKSILKKTRAGTPQPASSSAVSQDEKNREIALYHANLIQQRKDAEAQVFENLEQLMDYPPDESTPINPTTQTANEALRLLQPFQPSDFESLIEERNINHKCGYFLCPNRNRDQKTKAKYRLVFDAQTRGRDAQVVETKALQRWCSEDCARRAMFVKLQMSETPSWERVTSESIALKLYNDRTTTQDGTAPSVTGIAESLKELALERGDKNIANAREGTISFDIKEKLPSETRKPAAPRQGDAIGEVEGHVPKVKWDMKNRARKNSDDDDEMRDDTDDHDELDLLEHLGKASRRM